MTMHEIERNWIATLRRANEAPARTPRGFACLADRSVLTPEHRVADGAMTWLSSPGHPQTMS
jgi:hypothetical protein